MARFATITWRSITVLPLLIGASAGVVILFALSQRFSLHLSVGLLLSVLAVVEVGYLAILIVVNRNGHTLPRRSRSLR